MRCFVLIACVALFLVSCGISPSDKVIARIGNSKVFVSDAEFLASIRPVDSRSRKAIEEDLQQIADNRRLAEVARKLYAGEQSAIQGELANFEDARLAQVYTFFFLRANLGHTNQELINYYKKNIKMYPDSIINDDIYFAQLRERIANDLFLSKHQEESESLDSASRIAFLDSCRRAVLENEKQRLIDRYKIEEVKIEPPGLQEYYEQHPEEFKTKTAYKLFRLADSDSVALASKMKPVKNLEQFISISAVQMPVVKQGNAIQDIGMFPALFDILQNTESKKFTPVLRSTDTQQFFVFYIDSIIPPQLKPWDRARALAKSIVESKGDFPLDSAFVLVTENGKPFITEKDVLELQAKIPPYQRKRRAQTVSMIIDNKIYAKAAREKGVDKAMEFIAWNRQLLDQQYVRMLNDSLLSRGLGIPEDSLKIAYEAEKDSLFASKDFENSRLDVAVWMRIPDLSYRREFALNADKYPNASKWQDIKREAYRNIRYNEFSALQEAITANLQKSIPVSIVDASWNLEFAAMDKSEILAHAKKSYEARETSAARKDYERLRALFPQDDELQRSVSFELANLYQELGNYNVAANEYKAIIGMYPNESDTYKAYFMRGFVLAEYIKNDSLALQTFEEMLNKFPNSDLSGDAKIMVENIRSGGKIIEDLMKKIESENVQD